MITLEKIINSNLEMLKGQESELLKSLEFVRKARQLFESGNGRTVRAGRGRSRVLRAGSVSKGSSKATRKSRKRSKVQSGTHLAEIVSILKQHNGKATSGDVIKTMFKKQKKNKDFKHYRQLIYPVLTRAYKSGALALKDGVIHLSA